ncbi:MAG: helix-turn-helix domain-containing protein [Thermoleophilia bacterium]|nr:helix-turn-helix domain-containing protein [Thermoleophilia bacterium]
MFELGNNLREARQHRRIDLVIAEQDTKIRSKYLAALETEDFDVLPGPVFVRGFLRTYSRYLGLDPQLFIEEYNARFGRFEELDEHQHSPVLGRPGLAQAREQRGRRTMRVLAIATVVIIAGFAWLGLRQPDESSVRDAEMTSADTATTPEARAATGGLDAAANAAVDAPAAGAGKLRLGSPAKRARLKREAAAKALATREAAAGQTTRATR